MKISKRSQLGLKFEDQECKINCMKALKMCSEKEIERLNHAIDELDPNNEYCLPKSTNKFDQLLKLGLLEKLISNDNGKYYLICDSVYKASELVKINSDFSGRTYKDIELGKHTYLMGKNLMTRFIVDIGKIKGLYYNDLEKIAFEWIIDIETSNYDCGNYNKEFSLIMRILAFVELGDIEVIELQPGRSNNRNRKSGKISNASDYNVFVVDSSWNKLIIRSDGFPVRGHFRLQPCGESLKDRKLKWINSFEKHGYTRRPKAEIIR